MLATSSDEQRLDLPPSAKLPDEIAKDPVLAALAGHMQGNYLWRIPYMHALGGEVVDGKLGGAHIRMPVRAAICDPQAPAVIDARALVALLDQVASASVHTMMQRVEALATLDLRVDMFGDLPAHANALAHATCTRVHNRTAFMNGFVLAEDGQSEPCMAFNGRFIVGASPGGPSMKEAARNFTDYGPYDIPDAANLDEMLGVQASGNDFELPFQRHLVGSIFLPALHGGATAGALMTAAERRARQFPPAAGMCRRMASLTFQYLRAARAETTYLLATPMKVGAQTLVCEVLAVQGEDRKPVAALQCLFVSVPEETRG